MSDTVEKWVEKSTENFIDFPREPPENKSKISKRLLHFLVDSKSRSKTIVSGVDFKVVKIFAALKRFVHRNPPRCINITSFYVKYRIKLNECRSLKKKSWINTERLNYNLFMSQRCYEMFESKNRLQISITMTSLGRISNIIHFDGIFFVFDTFNKFFELENYQDFYWANYIFYEMWVDILSIFSYKMEVFKKIKNILFVIKNVYSENL